MAHTVGFATNGSRAHFPVVRFFLVRELVFATEESFFFSLPKHYYIARYSQQQQVFARVANNTWWHTISNISPAETVLINSITYKWMTLYLLHIIVVLCFFFYLFIFVFPYHFLYKVIDLHKMHIERKYIFREFRIIFLSFFDIYSFIYSCLPSYSFLSKVLDRCQMHTKCKCIFCVRELLTAHWRFPDSQQQGSRCLLV